MISYGDEVTVQKIGVVDDPKAETPDWEDYREGELNASSVPVEYEVQGSLVSPVEEGEPIVLYRTQRNGTEAAGIFRTSEVQSLEETQDHVIAKTQNSIYRIQ